MAQKTQLTYAPLKGVIQLTRWKEQIPFISLTFLGGLAAFSLHATTLDWRLVAVAVANFLTVSFAFMINDIEDADDDARNPVSARRNPVTNGMLDLRTAWTACALFVVSALSLYTVGGQQVVLIGSINLILSFLYSWKPIRLKSSTIGLDVISHSLMLGGLLPLAGYFIYTTTLEAAVFYIAASVTLGSMYGQLYNQVRDYESDSEAGIVNVAIRLGERGARLLMYAALAGSSICGIVGALMLSYPAWAPQAIAASIAIGLAATSFVNTDASGKPPLDITGRLQAGFWIAFNLGMALWVLWAMELL